MGGALALLAALVASASADVEAGIRVEGRATSTTVGAGPALERTGAVAQGHAGAVLLTQALQLSADYAPRVWSSDLQASPTPLVEHAAGLRLETARPGPWRAEVGASGTRGRTDPLGDPLAAAQTGTSQLVSATPLRYESLRTAGRVERRLDPGRTTLEAGASWLLSRGQDAVSRQFLPDQRTVTAMLADRYLVSPRDTLRVLAEGNRTRTTTTGGELTTSAAALSGTWRRLLTPSTAAWLGGGASAVEERGAGARPTRILPNAQVGVATAWEQSGVALETSATLHPVVDRLTGLAEPAADATVLVRWRRSAATTATASATGGSRLDGETVILSGDANVAWALRDRLPLVVGTRWHWNHERRPQLPSYVDGGFYVAIAWDTLPARRAPAPAAETGFPTGGGAGGAGALGGGAGGGGRDGGAAPAGDGAGAGPR